MQNDAKMRPSVVPYANSTGERVLQMAASVNRESEHSLAKAMVEEARKEGLLLFAVKNFEALAGEGSQGRSRGN